jgi:hypothetical protein
LAISHSARFTFQNRIRTSEGQTRAENLAHLEKLKLQLSELEKQYEKSKPLVNLVDNMVKLGSLYRGGNHRYPNETTTLDRLEFNQRIQERRLMQEEQRQWERMSPNQTELQVEFHPQLSSNRVSFQFPISLPEDEGSAALQARPSAAGGIRHAAESPT